MFSFGTKRARETVHARSSIRHQAILGTRTSQARAPLFKMSFADRRAVSAPRKLIFLCMVTFLRHEKFSCMRASQARYCRANYKRTNLNIRRENGKPVRHKNARSKTSTNFSNLQLPFRRRILLISPLKKVMRLGERERQLRNRLQ